MAINTDRTDPYNQKFNEIARTFYSRYVLDRKGKNVIISPLSIVVLLAMAAESTTGKARQEIAKVLSGNLAYETALKAIDTLQKGLTEEDNLVSSNAAIVNQKVKNSINPEYREKLAETFMGELFCSANIGADVNAWVKEKTRGMIEKIAPENADQMLAALINAIAFEANWDKEYWEDDITEGEFNNADGTKSTVAMLNSTEHSYIENGSFTGFIKPYEGQNFSFMALLPKKPKMTMGLKKAIRNIDFSELFESARYERVITQIPEFKGEFGIDLSGLLHKLGIKTVFSGKADFSPLTSEWLRVDSIIHKAKIEVDRKGTRAAAATAMVINAGAVLRDMPKMVILDRPFIYAIIHNQTKLPVFTGITNHI